MYIKSELWSGYELYQMTWSGGRDTMDDVMDADKADELLEVLEEMFPFNEDNPPTDTEINDFLWHEREYIYNLLGMEE